MWCMNEVADTRPLAAGQGGRRQPETIRTSDEGVDPNPLGRYSTTRAACSTG